MQNPSNKPHPTPQKTRLPKTHSKKGKPHQFAFRNADNKKRGRNMKLVIVGGIRPDIINLSCLFQELQNKKIDFVFVWTGQHYSKNLSEIFFTELNVAPPKYMLNMPEGLGQGGQSGFVIKEIEEILLKEKPDAVISFSDANPCLAAITATKLGIKVIHLESGLRSNDFRMPEEKNRRIVDSISDLLFCPTRQAESNLWLENVHPKKIVVCGKLIIDVLKKHEQDIREAEKRIFGNDELGMLEKQDYIFTTLHRAENVQSKQNLQNILTGIGIISKKYDKPVLAYLHPRTITAINQYRIKKPENFGVYDPTGFFDFVALEKNAFMYIGDSGTCSEETTYFNIPSLITRPTTERPETVTDGTSVLVGKQDGTFNPETFANKTREALNKIPKKGLYKAGTANTITRTLKEKEEWIRDDKVMWDD